MRCVPAVNLRPPNSFGRGEVPPEVLRYSSPLKQLAAGSPGKLGSLRLNFSLDGGRTVLREVQKKVPLQVLRAFYYDETRPDLAIVYVLNPTGGILQGDRLRIDVSLEPNCKAHLTTQAATKIYRMNADYATQTMNLTLGEGSYLEYLPDQIIPYRNSRFFQEVNVAMHSGSTFVYWEILTSGRQGRERFEYEIFYSRLCVQSGDALPILSDTAVLEPKKSDLGRLGIMGKNDTLGNFYAIGDRIGDSLAEKIQSLGEKEQDAIMGVSPTSLVPGLVMRALGSSSRQVKAVLERAWNEVRVEIFGSPAPRIRK